MTKYFSRILCLFMWLLSNLDKFVAEYTEIQVRNTSSFLSNGFGELYEWKTLDDGLSIAKTDGKPIMMVIHKINCPACEALKSKFSSSEGVYTLRNYFIMVNIEEQELENGLYSPDGKYVPRVLFLDSKGHVHPEIYNKKGNPEYKYFYHKIEDLVQSMKKAAAGLTAYSNIGEL